MSCHGFQNVSCIMYVWVRWREREKDERRRWAGAGGRREREERRGRVRQTRGMILLSSLSPNLGIIGIISISNHFLPAMYAAMSIPFGEER